MEGPVYVSVRAPWKNRMFSEIRHKISGGGATALNALSGPYSHSKRRSTVRSNRGCLRFWLKGIGAVHTDPIFGPVESLTFVSVQDCIETWNTRMKINEGEKRRR